MCWSKCLLADQGYLWQHLPRPLSQCSPRRIRERRQSGQLSHFFHVTSIYLKSWIYLWCSGFFSLRFILKNESSSWILYICEFQTFTPLSVLILIFQIPSHFSRFPLRKLRDKFGVENSRSGFLQVQRARVWRLWNGVDTKGCMHCTTQWESAFYSLRRPQWEVLVNGGTKRWQRVAALPGAAVPGTVVQW